MSTGTKSIVFLNPAVDLGNGFRFNHNDFKNNLFNTNFLTDDLENTDRFRKNNSQIITQFQRLHQNHSLLLCLHGNLFDNNSLIKGITFLNIKLFYDRKRGLIPD